MQKKNELRKKEEDAKTTNKEKHSKPDKNEKCKCEKCEEEMQL